MDDLMRARAYELTCGKGHKAHMRLVSNLPPITQAACFRCGSACLVETACWTCGQAACRCTANPADLHQTRARVERAHAEGRLIPAFEVLPLLAELDRLGAFRDLSQQLEQLTRIRAMCTNGEAAAIRRRAHATLADVGRVVGASTSAVHKWETGEAFPTDERLLKYADVLDMLRSAAT